MLIESRRRKRRRHRVSSRLQSRGAAPDAPTTNCVFNELMRPSRSDIDILNPSVLRISLTFDIMEFTTQRSRHRLASLELRKSPSLFWLILASYFFFFCAYRSLSFRKYPDLTFMMYTSLVLLNVYQDQKSQKSRRSGGNELRE